jgi:hypothetical protein
MKALPTALVSSLTAAFTVAVLSFAQAPPTCPYGATWNGSVWTCNPTPLIPAGMISFVVTGICPPGYSEVAALNGQILRGTVAANLDIGTTGGSDTLTPSGTVAAPTFTGSSVTVPAETIVWPTGVPIQSADTFGTTNFVTVGGPTPAFVAQSAIGAIAWPADVPTNGTVSVTATGTNSVPAFTGASVDSRPAFTRVIACQKT